MMVVVCGLHLQLLLLMMMMTILLLLLGVDQLLGSVVGAEKLGDVVVDVRCLALDEHPQRPGQE